MFCSCYWIDGYVGKSEIVPIGEISNLDNLAIFLRCMVDSFANEIFGNAFGCSV